MRFVAKDVLDSNASNLRQAFASHKENKEEQRATESWLRPQRARVQQS
jgi:hypothetical protein